MTWSHRYEVGQEARGYFHADGGFAWRQGTIVSRRADYVVMFFGKYGHIQFYHAHQVQPWD